MSPEILPEVQEFRYPVYENPLAYSYQLMISTRRQTLQYSAPHELIINCRSYNENDQVVYQTRDKRANIFSFTVKTFQVMTVDSLRHSTDDELEILYMRLILTNWHSHRIIDKGTMRQCDLTFRRFLTGVKGGYDYYLGSTTRGQVLYFKHRRMSCLHLLAMVMNLNYTNNVNYTHINVPFDAMKRGLVYECLRADPYTARFSLNHYEPTSEDNIQETDIRREIIRAIRHLITRK